jgi:dihydrofolate synthase/folylpolyglutamate synthase
VIHIAGTNGKGSLVAFLEAALLHTGHRVQAYTSPHLVHFNERLRLQGEDVSDDLLQPALQRVADALPTTPATFLRRLRPRLS